MLLLEIYLKFTFCFLRFMADEESSSSSSISSDLHAILDAQKNAILSAVNTQIQGLQSNLLKSQTDLASQIASKGQGETYILKKKGNEQQFNFNRKVIKKNSAAVMALESGNIGKAKEELNEGISLLNNRQKIVKLADKSEFGWATVQEYVCDDLADDEADASNIKKAKRRAAARLKTLQEKKKRSGTKFSFSMPVPNSASRFGGASGSFPPVGSYFRSQGRYSGNIFRGSNLCFRCGKRGHWASSFPAKDKPFLSESKSCLFGF